MGPCITDAAIMAADEPESADVHLPADVIICVSLDDLDGLSGDLLV